MRQQSEKRRINNVTASKCLLRVLKSSAQSRRAACEWDAPELKIDFFREKSSRFVTFHSTSFDHKGSLDIPFIMFSYFVPPAQPSIKYLLQFRISNRIQVVSKNMRRFVARKPLTHDLPMRRRHPGSCLSGNQLDYSNLFVGSESQRQKVIPG